MTRPAFRRRVLRRAVYVTVLLLGTASTVTADSEPQDDETLPPAQARGAIAWIGGEALDLWGELGLDAPVARIGPFQLGLRIETTTTIQKTLGDFTFLVRELLYQVEGRLQAPTLRWTAVVGQRGREAVDRPGQGFVRYVGLGRSWTFPRGEAAVELGPVVDRREVRAEGYGRATLRFELAAAESGAWLVDGSYDGLFGEGSLAGDARLGPTWRSRGARTEGLELFAHYLHARHPLGARVRGALLGMAYRARSAGNPSSEPGHLSGLLAAGTARRHAGRLWLVFHSPPLGRGRLAADFDLHVLTADDTGDLYYLYRLGYEQPRPRWLWGVSFYHRSNHQLAEPGGKITSLNVLEWSAESLGWRVPHAEGAPRAPRWEGRLRAGALLTSSFGERRRWHLDLGARWWVRRAARSPRPYVELEAEAGDVQRRRYAAGVRLERVAWFVELRRDTQWFSRDRDAWLLGWQRAFGSP